MTNYKDMLDKFQKSINLRSENCFYVCNEHPEKIAFLGKCRIFVPSYPFYNIKGFKSKVFYKPTYKEIFELCEVYIEKTGNPHDRYFQYIIPPENNAENFNITDYNIDNIDEYLKETYKPFILDPERVYNIEMRMAPMSDAIDLFMIIEIIKK